MKQILVVVVLVTFFVVIAVNRDAAQEDDKSAVEATVRQFERACQDFDFDQADSILLPDARWIEYSLPAKLGDIEWPRLRALKSAGVRISFRVHDFEINVRGDVAWVTLTLDGTFTSDGEDGRKLLNPTPGRCVSQGTHVSCNQTFVESEVLVRTTAGWKIALGHTSSPPKAEN
jgi:ketosteroid isomerase-like protein